MSDAGVGADLSRVKFTNLEKVLYPSLGVTKKQVVEYYLKDGSVDAAFSVGQSHYLVQVS